MKFASLNYLKPVILLVALATPTLLAAQNQSPDKHQVHYTVQDLGSLGGSLAQAGGISNTGWVEGFSLLPGDEVFHVFLWHKGVMTDLGTLGGSNSFAEYRPNNFGDAGGYSETSIPDPNGEDFCGFGNGVICLAFFWHNNVMTAQPTLGGNNASGFGTNDWGQMAGMAENTTPEPTCDDSGQIFQYKPVVWKKGRIRELPTLSGDPVGEAIAINIWGQSVGVTGPCFAGNFGVTSHMVLWQNGKAIALGNLGGDMGNFAQDVNDWNQVVGLSDLSGDATFHAFLWQNGKIRDLGTLPGDVHSNAESINNLGEIVGKSSDADFNGGAVIWRNGVITDLNALIPPDSPLYLLNATSNNDWGQIVGSALDNNTGEIHAFLATPTHGDGADQAEATRKAVQRPKVTLPKNVAKMLDRRGRGIVHR